MEYIKAFLIGGLICAAVQILMDKTKLLPGRIMVLLVVTGAVLGWIGIYEPFAEWAGCEGFTAYQVLTNSECASVLPQE